MMAGLDDVKLSRVGLGAYAIGGPWEFGWGQVSDDESAQTIRRAVDLGVNWIDTAPVYGFGHSEEVVGHAISPFRAGEDVLVFTKCGRSWYGRPDGTIENDLRPESIRFECEQSLRRLGVERIDLFQIHWPDWSTGTLLEDSWQAMADLVAAGKVRAIGVCNFDTGQLDRCELAHHVSSLQPPLSLLARGTLQTVIPWAHQHGTAVIVYSPMAGGLLTGNFGRRAASLDADDWRRKSPAFAEPQLSRSLDLVERLRPVAARLGASIPALAVAWTLAQPGVTGAIVGARRPDQVDGWAAAPALVLDGDTLGEIDRAIAASGAGSDEPPAPPARMMRPQHELPEEIPAKNRQPRLG
jgi:aryl-alcohol dehydrogenase-like predicted oxidoreductase